MNKLTINKNEKYQVFENFGASGAWWAQSVGGWNETDEASGMPKVDRISELLFDREKGIGLGCYRYNLGSGSANSGNGRYSSEARRAESFDGGKDGVYDWSRDKNAVNMMKKAVEYGANEIIFFVNSPIERLTKNHKGYLDRAGKTNLHRKNYRAFADYCLDVTAHFIAEGIPVKYLSPVNEPVWVWTENQEGCHYRPHQVRAVMKTFCEEMEKRNDLGTLKLSGAENGDIRWFNKMYCIVMLGNKKIRSHIDAIDVHSYFVLPDVPMLKNLISNRKAFMKRFKAFMNCFYPDVPIKISEWTHMCGGRDYGMKSALEQTKIIMEDLTILNAASWQHWIALSEYDYCDGLIYYFPEDRRFELTKRYYAFGNFSKFIPFGSVRIACDAGEKLDSVAFMKDGRISVVIANRTNEDVQLSLPSIPEEVYITSEKMSLEKAECVDSLSVPAESVITVILGG